MPEMDPRGEAAAQSSEAARQFLSERVTRALNRKAQQELVLMFGLDQRQGYRIFFWVVDNLRQHVHWQYEKLCAVTTERLR